MPVIRVSDETWERLKEWAVPLEDTPDDVMNRVLNFAQQHKRRSGTGLSAVTTNVEEDFPAIARKRLPKGAKVSDEAYFKPILEALYEHGGKGDSKEVLRIVERKMKHLFKDVDYQALRSGTDVRWRNTAQWARYKLVERGLLRNDSPHGIWELSDKGIEEVEKSRS